RLVKVLFGSLVGPPPRRAPRARLGPVGAVLADKEEGRGGGLGFREKATPAVAPTPTKTSTNSVALMLKKGTRASPATARASSVLPLPGGPTRSTPLGILAPRLWYFLGSRRKSTSSCSSRLAASTPATSAKVVLGRSM